MCFQGNYFVVKGDFKEKTLGQRNGCSANDVQAPGKNWERRKVLELEKRSCGNEKEKKKKDWRPLA